MKVLKYLYFTASWLPLAWLTVFLAFAARAWLKLGHLPVPSLNDPKYLGLDIHYFLVWLVYLTLLSLVPYWLFITIYGLAKKMPGFRLIFHVIVFILGCAAVVCLAKFDPYRLIEWYLD